MRRACWSVAALVIAAGIAMSFAGSAEAAPVGPSAIANQSAGSLATPVHCRIYRALQNLPSLPSPVLVAPWPSPLPPNLPLVLRAQLARRICRSSTGGGFSEGRPPLFTPGSPHRDGRGSAPKSVQPNGPATHSTLEPVTASRIPPAARASSERSCDHRWYAAPERDRSDARSGQRSAWLPETIVPAA